MKKVLKAVLYLVLVLIVLVISFAAFIYFRGIPTYDPPQINEFTLSPTEQKIEEGARISALICSSCHMGSDGKLSGGLMKDLDPAFGTAYIANITNHPVYGIGKWTASELAHFLRTGLRADGRYAPPWMPKFNHLSDRDLESIICFLKSDRPQVQASEQVHPASQPSFFAKFLGNTVFKPLAYPNAPIVAPDTNDLVNYGKYIAHGKIECYTCHSADFAKMNLEFPEKSLGYMGGGNTLIDLDKKKIFSANITMDTETGIGKWTYEDFYKALKEGKRPDGKALRYPMLPLGNLKDFEIKGLWAYLQTVPKIKNPVNRNWN